MELQLIDTLKLYFPAALKLFSDITNKISLAFLSQCPTPKKAKKLTLKRFQFVLKKHKYTKPGRAEEIFSILQQDYPIASRLLSCFGDRRDRFTHFNDIQCLAGTVPVTRESGRPHHVFFSFYNLTETY